MSWPTFLAFWKKEYLQIKIRKKGSDTCTDCAILCNEFRFGKRNTQEEPNEDENENDENRDPNSNLVSKIENASDILIRAKKHVKEYRIQKQTAASFISLAKLDILYHLPSLLRRKVLTIDMGQNLCLPNFEGEQPGKHYIRCLFLHTALE